MPEKIYCFRGRNFTSAEIELIEKIVKQCWFSGRTNISRVVCEKLGWYQFNGRLKKVACREALRRMEKKGLLVLPPTSTCGGRKEIKKLTAEKVNFKKPLHIIEGNIKTLSKLHFELVDTQKNHELWRYLIQTYHYLGYKQTVGRYLKYFVYLSDQLVALLGFGDGIYHHNLRDKWIGWSKISQEKRRHLIVNNVRFLILPWIKVKNLASKVLSRASKILPIDWEKKYGYKPLLLETFVDIERYRGTCYRAANWIYLGQTAGKGRCGMKYFVHGKPKDIYAYPLCKNCLKKLRT